MPNERTWIVDGKPEVNTGLESAELPPNRSPKGIAEDRPPAPCGAAALVTVTLYADPLDTLLDFAL